MPSTAEASAATARGDSIFQASPSFTSLMVSPAATRVTSFTLALSKEKTFSFGLLSSPVGAGFFDSTK